MATKVFRIETEQGEGPYIGGYDNGARVGIDFDDRRQPAPREDGLEDFPRSHSFGFKSVEQLKDWFHDHERRHLAAHSYGVSVYEAADVRLGGKQVVFKRDEARLLERLALTAV